MLRDLGTLDLEEVFAPAIGYAEHGAPIVPKITLTIETVREVFVQHWPSSAAVYLLGGKVPQPGTLLGNGTLARTWRRLLDEAKAAKGGREARIDAARDAFYKGFVPEAIDRFCRAHDLLDASGAPPAIRRDLVREDRGTYG